MRLFVNVVDCAFGVMAPNVEMHLTEQYETEWRHVARGYTDADGWSAEWGAYQPQGGTCQLEINLDGYYAMLGIIPLYPKVTVEFRASDPTVDLNLTILITVNSFHVYWVDDTPAKPWRIVSEVISGRQEDSTGDCKG
jgi:5-hydroxyisourate hydrolase